MMPTSLLGEKGGYDCEYNISTAPLSITSKYSESSQQRFHSKQVDFNDQKAKLATLKDERKVQGDEYLADVVLKNQIYTSLVQSLHTFWYWKLPPHIRKALHNTLLASLPRCFMVWWFIWSEEDPAQFPMPAVISNRFPHYELDEDDYDSISPLLVDVHHNQTELGNFLEEAWNTIDVLLGCLSGAP